MLPRLEMYRKEREKREEADANVALLMKQVAELTEKLDKLQGMTEVEMEDKHDEASDKVESKADVTSGKADDKAESDSKQKSVEQE